MYSVSRLDVFWKFTECLASKEDKKKKSAEKQARKTFGKPKESRVDETPEIRILESSPVKRPQRPTRLDLTLTNSPSSPGWTPNVEIYWHFSYPAIFLITNPFGRRGKSYFSVQVRLPCVFVWASASCIIISVLKWISVWVFRISYFALNLQWWNLMDYRGPLRPYFESNNT